MSHKIPQGEQEYMQGSTSRASEDRKFYFPCRNYKGLRPRRILIKLAKKHCRDYGHTKGRHEYHPFVSYLLYVFVLYIIFVNIYMYIVF